MNSVSPHGRARFDLQDKVSLGADWRSWSAAGWGITHRLPQVLQSARELTKSQVRHEAR